MSNSFIVSGSMFGDEGKGTICDYLANKYDLKENVRYNGGSQASHTVIVGNEKHKFSQLGSGMLNETRTYLSDNTIVNLFNIICEAKVLREVTGRRAEDILKNVYIDENASIVTPYHALINQLRELSLKEKSLGSVGTGVSEVYKVKQLTGIELKVKDLINGSSDRILRELFRYTSGYFKEKRKLIDDEQFEILINEKDIYYLTNPINRGYLIRCYSNLLESNLFNIVSGINEFHEYSNVLFEGSQGLLLDMNYGIKPNITSLDTTNKYGINLANKINTQFKTVGCVGALNSRHGKGLLPTYSEYLQSIIHDENQLPSYFQGVPRYGYFDIVLFNYSHLVNPNDTYFMSALDRLTGLKEFKICNGYLYNGVINEEFENTFDYIKDNENIIIYGIKKQSDLLKSYLLKCSPLYLSLTGSNECITEVKNFNDLPDEYIDYVETIEELSNTNISIVGVGEDRCQKLERRK